jgi:Uma2 family endonuclease
MAELLEIPEVRQRLSRFSVEEYHRLGEFNGNGRRTELIRGLIIEKMSKSPLHRIIVSRLFRLLLAQLPKGYSIWKGEPLTFVDSEPEPDISVTIGQESDYLLAHPTTAELVIEVAVSSPGLDRENAKLYAEAAVKEYWIVLGLEKRIEVHRCPRKGGYEQQHVVGLEETLQCESVPALRVLVSDLFASR